MEALDKINKLPLNPMIEQATSTLSESQRTMKKPETTLDSIEQDPRQPVDAAAADGYAVNVA